MRVLAVNASDRGYRDPEHNNVRERCFVDLLAEALRRDCSILILPGAFWTLEHEADMADYLSGLADLARAKGVAVVGGVDLASPLRKTGLLEDREGTKLEAAIRSRTLPFFGFAIDEAGAVHGPWRQLSSTHLNAELASAYVREVDGREVLLQGRSVVPLVCGEMHNAELRERLGRLTPDLVTVSGHAYLGCGLVPTLKAVFGQTESPVVHVQHLVENTRGSMYVVDGDGNKHSLPVDTDWWDYGDGFWVALAAWDV